MSTVANVEARIQSVSVTDDVISAQLVDGRTISVPLVWSWDSPKQHPSSVHDSRLSAAVLAYTGPGSAKTSAWIACSTEFQHEGHRNHRLTVSGRGVHRVLDRDQCSAPPLSFVRVGAIQAERLATLRGSWIEPPELKQQSLPVRGP